MKSLVRDSGGERGVEWGQLPPFTFGVVYIMCARVWNYSGAHLSKV